MTLGLNIPFIYFRHIKVSWVKAYQFSLFLSSFQCTPEITELVTEMYQMKKFIDIERSSLSMSLLLSDWFVLSQLYSKVCSMEFGSFITIQVCRELIPALAPSCKKQLRCRENLNLTFSASYL